MAFVPPGGFPPERTPRRLAGPSPAAGLVAALGFLLAALTAPTRAAAQEFPSDPLLGPLVPSGHLRVGVDPEFVSWDRRFGLADDGATSREELGQDLADPLGTSLFPGIARLAEDFAALNGGSAPSLALGESYGSVTKNITRLDFSAHLGVFDWLTVGATLPWVKTRTAVDVLFEPAADPSLGLNPARGGGGEVAGYLENLMAARSSASARSESVCGTAPGSEDCSAARSLAERTAAFAGRVAGMYGASPFFLLSGSQASEAFGAVQAALEQELVAAGLEGLADPVYASDAVDRELFAELPTRGEVGVVGSPLQDVNGLWSAGDLELEALVRLLDGEVRDSGAAVPSFAWTLAGGARVRLGTGTPENPDIFLDLGTGDGQMDLEGFGYGAVRMGRHWGVRAAGRYGVQGSTILTRRVAAPETLLPPASSRQRLEWTPGDYLDLMLSPRFRVNETLALAVDYRLFTKGSDRYRYGGGGAGGPEPAVLEAETEQTFQEVALGLRYSSRSRWRSGDTGTPVEISARVARAVAGSGGQTPVSTRIELALRLFRRLWGG